MLQVVYLYPSTDAAFAASSYKDLGATFTALGAGDNTRDWFGKVNEGDDVVFIGVCPAFLADVLATSSSVTVYGCHESLVKLLESNSSAKLHNNVDVSKACCLQISTIFPQGVLDVLRLVADHQLQTKLYSTTPAFTEAFAARKIELDINKNPKLWEQLAALNANELIKEGEALLKAQEDELRALEANVDANKFTLLIPGKDAKLSVQAWVAPAGFAYQRINAVCLQLAKQSESKIGAMVTAEKDGNFKFALRSVDGADTLTISSCYGGGGKPPASGFTVNGDVYKTFAV